MKKPIGKLHNWWMKQFHDAYKRHKGGICVSGYEGSAYGRALVGLLNRELVQWRVGFEGGFDLLELTEKGKKHLGILS